MAERAIDTRYDDMIVLVLGDQRDWKGRRAWTEVKIDLGKLMDALLAKAISQAERHDAQTGKTTLQAGAIVLTVRRAMPQLAEED